MYGARAESLAPQSQVQNWLPLVDALRTRLLTPTPDVVETLDSFYTCAGLRRGLAIVS